METTNDTILITGGGSGIGRAFAEALHAKGARVIIASRREAALKEVAAANPGMAYEVLDVADAADITAFTARVIAAHPDLNVVVNNAGIMKAEDLSGGVFDMGIVEDTIATNLFGTIRLTAALLPHLDHRHDAHRHKRHGPDAGPRAGRARGRHAEHRHL